jgi:hypothetical protein
LTAIRQPAFNDRRSRDDRTVQLSLADDERFGKYGKRDITDSGATFLGRRRKREHWFW